VRQQQFPIVGNGEGVWSWLHIEDAAIATVAAAEQGNPGIYLIANDQPLAVREWLPAFAQWLNAPPPPQMPVEDALKASGADAGLLRDSDARRIECQGKTRTEFSAATVGVDR
jgi:2-alkyl-3-oxoalkanoate reductase